MPTNRSVLDPFNRNSEIMDFINRRDASLDNSRFRSIIHVSERDFDSAMDEIRRTYKGAEDPNDYVTRQSLGRIVGNYLHIDPKVASKNIDQLYYSATGYRSNVKGLGEHLVNTFNASGSSILAGVRTLGFLINNIGLDDEEFNTKWEEFQNDTLSRYARTYRSDLYLDNHGMIADLLTSAANIAPSMIPTLTLSGIVALASIATGGGAGIAAASGIGSFAKAFSTLNTAQRVVGGANIVGRTLLTGVMEAGGTTLDMLEMGFDKDVILPTATVVGLINGAIENISTFEDKLTAPIASIVDNLGRRRANDIFHEAINATFKGIGKEYLSSLATEPVEEALQELSSMIGINIGIAFQNATGRPLEDVIPYSASDIANAMFDTMVETAKGTLVMGLAGSAINAGSNALFGDMNYNLRADRVTERTDSSGNQAGNVVDTRRIHRPESNGTKPSGKVPAVRFANIAGEYYALDPTPEQEYVLRNSRYVYGTVDTNSYSPDWANNTTTTYNGGVTLDTANQGIRKAFENGDLVSYAYVTNTDGQIQEVRASEATHIAVQSNSFDGISLFPIVQEGGESLSDFEFNAFGKVYDKVSETNQNTSSTTASSDSTPLDDDIEVEYDDVDEQSVSDIAEGFNEAVNDTLNNNLSQDVSDAINELNADINNISVEPIEQADNVIDASPDTITDNTQQAQQENNSTQDRAIEQDVTEQQTDNINQEQVSSTETPVENTEVANDNATPDSIRNSGSESVETYSDVVDDIISEQDKPAVEKFRKRIRESMRLSKSGQNQNIMNSVVEASVAVAQKFADAQGKTFTDFINGISSIDSTDIVNNDGGWYDSVRKLIRLNKDASPTTFIHELAHHFLNTLQDGDVKTYIEKTYANQFKKDGNKIGTEVQEAFANNLEKYIYLRRTNNSRLRAVFENLYQLAKTLWNKFSNKSRLSENSRLLFDYLLSDTSDRETNLNRLTEAIKEGSNQFTTNKDIAKKVTKQKKTRDEKIEEFKESIKEENQQIANSNFDPAVVELANKIKQEAIDKARSTRLNNSIGIDELNSRLVDTKDVDKTMSYDTIEWPDDKPVSDMDNINIEAEESDRFERSINSIEKELNDAVSALWLIGSSEDVVSEADNSNISISSLNKNGILGVINSVLGTNMTNAISFFQDGNGNIYARMNVGIEQNGDTFSTYQYDGRKSYWVFIPVSEDFADPDIGLISLREEYELNGIDTEGIFDGDKLSELYIPDAKIIANVFLKNLAIIQNDFSEKPASRVNTDNGILHDTVNTNEISDADADMYASIVLNDFTGQEIHEIIDSYNSISEQKESIMSRFNESVDKYLSDNKLEDNDTNKMAYMDKLASEMYGYDSFEQMDKLSMSDFILGNERISRALSGFNQTALNKISLSMSDFITHATESYSFAGRELSNGFKSKNDMNTAVNRLSEIYKTAKKHASSAISFKADLKTLMDVNKPMFDRFIKLMEGKGSVATDEARFLLRRFVSADGNLSRVVRDDSTSMLNSPLIYLLDYAHTRGKKDSHFEGDSNYISASQNLLRDTYTETISDEGNISLNLVDLISKLMETMGDGVLAEFYEGYSTSASMSDAIINQIDNIVKQDRAEADKLLQILRDKNAELSKVMESVNSIKEDYTKEINEKSIENKATKEEIRNIKEKYNKKLEELRSRYDINNMVNEINELKKKIKDQQSYFNAIAKNPKLNLVNQMRSAYAKYFRDIAKKYSKGDSRGGFLVRRFVDVMKNSAGKVFPSNIFTSSWEGYDMAPFKAFAEKYLELRSDESGNLMNMKNLRSLNIEQLGELEDIINNFMEEANERRKERARRRDIDIMSFRNSLIRSVFANNEEISDEDVTRLIKEATENIRPGSNTERDRMSKWVGFVRDTEILYNLTRRLSPEITNYLFFGKVNGKVATKSLNTMTNQEQKGVQQRVSRFYEVTANEFGIKPEQVRSRINELFSDKTVKLGSMSLYDFMSKNGIDFGGIQNDGGNVRIIYDDNLPARFQALATYVLRQQQKIYEEDVRRGNEFVPTETLFEDYINDEFRDFTEDNRDQSKYYHYLIGMMEDNTPENDSTYSMQKLMGIYELSKQDDLIYTLVQNTSDPGTGNNIPLGNLLWVIDQFENNPEYASYRKIADAMQEDLAGKYTEMADVYYAVENKVLDNVDFYSTAFKEGGDLPTEMSLEVDSAFGIGNEPTNRQNTADVSEIKERTGGNRPLKLDYVNNYFKAVQDQEHYIAFAEKMDEYKQIFASDGDLAKAIRAQSDISKKDLDTVLNKIQKTISLIAKRNTYSADFGSNLLNTVRGNMAKAVLWGNLSASLQNIPNYVHTLNDMSLARSFKGVVGFLSNYRENKAFINEISPQMRERSREELYTAKNPSRESMNSLDEMITDHFGEVSYKAKHAIHRIAEAGVKLVQSVEDFVAYAMWWAYYNNNIEVKYADMSSDPNFLRLCAEDATQQVMNFFPTQNVKDTSLLYTSKDSGVQHLLLFTSQLNKIFNVYYGSASDFWNDRNVDNFLKMMKVWGVTTGMVVATAAISGRFIGEDDDDDDEWIGNFVKVSLSEVASLLPYVGGNIRDAINNEFFLTQNVATASRNLIRVIRKDPDDRTEHQLGNALMREYVQISRLLGLPSSTVSKVWYTIRDQNIGELINSNWGNFDILGWED